MEDRPVAASKGIVHQKDDAVRGRIISMELDDFWRGLWLQFMKSRDQLARMGLAFCAHHVNNGLHVHTGDHGDAGLSARRKCRLD